MALDKISDDDMAELARHIGLADYPVDKLRAFTERMNAKAGQSDPEPDPEFTAWLDTRTEAELVEIWNTRHIWSRPRH
jgi:hypothetical protein